MRFLSYRNQFIDWFLYDRDVRYKRVKKNFKQIN